VKAMKTQYSIELIKDSRDGPTASILARENDLDTARALYRFCAEQFPNRVILLADRARVLARSDYP
jgi:hypothetical protein